MDVALLNENDKTIGRNSITLNTEKINFSVGDINVSPPNEVEGIVRFPNIKAEDLTPALTIVIVAVNGIPSRDLNASGYMKIGARNLTDRFSVGSEIKFTQVGSGTRGVRDRPFYSGIAVNRDDNSSIRLLINSSKGLQSVSYQFSSRWPVLVKEIKADTETFVIRIPKDLDLGQTRLEIRTWDITGIETVYEDYIIIIGSNGRDFTSDSYTFTWVRPHTKEGQIILSIGETLTGFFSGGPVESVEVEGDGGSLRAMVDQNGVVNVTAAINGNIGPIRLNLISKDGKKYTTSEYNFAVGSKPSIEMLNDPDGTLVQNQVQFQ